MSLLSLGALSSDTGGSNYWWNSPTSGYNFGNSASSNDMGGLDFGTTPGGFADSSSSTDLGSDSSFMGSVSRLWGAATGSYSYPSDTATSAEPTWTGTYLNSTQMQQLQNAATNGSTDAQDALTAYNKWLNNGGSNPSQSSGSSPSDYVANKVSNGVVSSISQLVSKYGNALFGIVLGLLLVAGGIYMVVNSGKE